MKDLLKFIVVLVLSSTLLAQVPEKEKVVAGAERAFEKVAKAQTAPGPGCAIGVSLQGESVFEKAFGLAEMEHNIPNTPQTIFESGSVAKQFTASALVLLHQDGKLSIDDPVKKYIPELPDYGAPLTIRHLLNHTSGIRDWFSVRALSGEGGGEHIVNQDMVLSTVVRQRGLDFAPGAEYSYSNSGYQLAAVIVERVSKQKFPDFISERIFKPLGMKNSAWRDDFRRIVPGRAHAYSKEGNGPWRLNMPMMNVFGGGGMLTTVGDWLKWNAMLDSRSMGTPLVEALETQGVLNDGRKIAYALGLSVGTYKGNKQISHTGATAGYRTVLSRFPDRKISIAVMCNGTAPNSGELANRIADEVLGPFPAQPVAETTKIPVDQAQKYVGLWKNEKTRAANRFSVADGELRFNTTPIRSTSDGSLMMGASKLTFKLDSSGKPISLEAKNAAGDVVRFTAETEWQPSPADLASFSGEWYSDDAEAKIKFIAEGTNAFLILKPSTRVALRPLYKDHFANDSGEIIWFDRDSSGKVEGLRIGGSRMRNMPFVRVK